MKRVALVIGAVLMAAVASPTFAGGAGAAGGGGRGGRGAAAGQAGQGNQGAGFGQGFGGAAQNGAGGAAANGRGGFGAGGGLAGTLGLNVAFYSNEFAILSQQVTLSDEQKGKVQAKVAAMNTELQTFLQNSAANARGGRGRGAVTPGALQSLTPEQIKIRDDYMALADEHQLKIDADLTDAQKSEWETYKLNLWLNPHLQGVNLTDDQRDKVKGIVADTAKAILALTDGREIETLEGRMFRKVVSDVLTEAQAAIVLLQTDGAAGAGRGGQLAAGNGAAGNGLAGNAANGAGQGNVGNGGGRGTFGAAGAAGAQGAGRGARGGAAGAGAGAGAAGRGRGARGGTAVTPQQAAGGMP